MSNHVENTFKGWVPLKLNAAGTNLLCRWLYVGDKDFTEPFFDDTIADRRSLPENGFLNKRMSSVDALTGQVKEVEIIEPTAFVFHISRCGSTLISQMLGMQTSNIILSEVPFIDEILINGYKKNRSITELIKAALGFYGAKRNEQNKQLLLKQIAGMYIFTNS